MSRIHAWRAKLASAETVLASCQAGIARPIVTLTVAHDVTRIFSDLHYGDRGSSIKTLPALLPLFEGAGSLVLNGDTLDTRPGPDPAATAALRAEVRQFFDRSAPPTTFLTGNHDPDYSPHGTLDLAGGEVFVTHGDIIFDELVPWSQDAPIIRQRLDAEFATMPPDTRDQLDARLAVYRRVALSIPQRHQSERNGLKYTVGFMKDTVWPPARVLRVLRAWRRGPELAAQLTRRHRPAARFAIIGHIHHPGYWRRPNGVTVLNTGSFCPPLGGCVIDVAPGRLELRRVIHRRGEFRLGTIVKVFALA